MRVYSSSFRTTVWAVLFLFLWCYGPLFQIPTAVAAEKRKTVAETATGRMSGAQKPEEKFEGALEAIRESVEKAGEKADKGEDDSAERASIKEKRAELDLLAEEFRNGFNETQQKLKSAGLSDTVLKRHEDFVTHFEKKTKELHDNLDGIEAAKTAAERKAKIEKTKEYLTRVKSPSRHQKIDPENLPLKAQKITKTREPYLKKEDFEKQFPKQKRNRLAAQEIGREWARIFMNGFEQKSNKQKPLLVAANGPLTGLLSSSPPSETLVFPYSVPSPPALESMNRGTNDFDLQSVFASSTLNLEPGTFNLAAATTVDPPTNDDLAETPEVQFTQEVRDLAAQLGNNSLRIFEAIRNNFRYEPYYGSLKGAQQTLRERAGNDIDLASLLISCYRAAGIPAHYVVATMTMPLSRAQSWLGLDDPKMVGRLLASAGVPVAVNYTSGNIRIEHVLVRAWVPFQNGRGALNGTGDTWVYVDPSFKESKVTQLLDQSIPAFDQTQYLAQLRSEDPSEYYSTLIQENLNSSASGRTVYAVARHREIVPLNFGMLLGMPEYDFVTVGGNFQEIPDQYRHKIAFELTDPDSLETSLTYQASTAEIAGKRMTLSYSAASSDDESIIDNYGDIFSTPAYLVKLKPELKIEGVSVTQGTPLVLGGSQTFTMRISSPSQDSEQVVNNVTAGGYYAVAFDLQTVTPDMVFERTQKLQDVNDLIDAGGTASLDDHAGELLYSTALTYFQKLDSANRKAQEFLKVNDLRGVSEAIFGIAVQPAYLYGIPKSVDVAGLYIDVDRDMHLPIPVDGNTTKIKEYNLLIGSNSSYFEHEIIEDIYSTEAISAVKALQLANSQGVPVYTINKENSSSYLPLLQMNSEIKADIENVVNAGKEVIVPQQEMSINDWRGVGFVAMVPDTGEAGYIISGGYAGGWSILKDILTWVKTKALSGNVAVAKETAAIENIIDREYAIFTGPDDVYATEDDVRLPYAKYNLFEYVQGPAGTKCDGQLFTNFYNPDLDFGAPLLELDASLMDKYISPNLKLSDMIVKSGSTAYARISGSLAVALNQYMQLLEEVLITPKTNSVYRTWYHNCELTPQGAVLNSNHMAGIAADVGVSEQQGVAAKIALGLFGKIGGVGHKKYNSFVHVDIGKAGREW